MGCAAAAHLEARLVELDVQGVAPPLQLARALLHLLQLHVEVAEALLVVLLHARHAVALRGERVPEVTDLPASRGVDGIKMVGVAQRSVPVGQVGGHRAARTAVCSWLLPGSEP